MSIWRLILLCLLLVALPLQGLAAGGFADCHQGAGVPASTAPSADHDPASHDDAPCHEADSTACSACAACCVAAVLPGGVPSLRQVDPQSARPTATPPAPRSVLPARLERPPRTPSA
jgi:hypothetical protein